MKIQASLLVVAPIMFVLFCFVTSPFVAKAADPVLSVAASEMGVSVGEVEFVVSPSVGELVELWGPPSRTLNLANDIRIWDDLGIRAYSKPGSRSAKSLSFTLKEQDSKIEAKSVFPGELKFPGGTVTSKTKSTELPGIGFKQDATLAKFYRLALLTASVLLEVDPDSGSVATLSLEFAL